jgi:hypothetical protein
MFIETWLLNTKYMPGLRYGIAAKKTCPLQRVGTFVSFFSTPVASTTGDPLALLAEMSAGSLYDKKMLRQDQARFVSWGR